MTRTADALELVVALKRIDASSARAIAEFLNTMHIVTSTGKLWTPTNVSSSASPRASGVSVVGALEHSRSHHEH